ncbi:MAG: hypothetical protein ACOCWI_01700, partial [Bacillota bacterium]
MYNASNDEYNVIKIDTSDLDNDEYREYTMYIHNDESATQSVKWAFSLGGDAEDEKIKGMLVVDDVRLAEVDTDEFMDAQRGFDELDEENQELSPLQLYTYDEERDPGDPEEPTEPEEEKDSIFDRGDVWLLVSTIVIGAVILVTVIVVLFKRFKKKHPKKVKGENVVKTEKSIETAPVEKSEKEDVVNEEEFTDKEEKPKYVQRVLPKKKKKK